MQEKELISKLSQLKQCVKPSPEWVERMEKEILGIRPNPLFLDLKRIFVFDKILKWQAGVVVGVLFILVGLFGFAQNTLPGDFLFSLKKITEKAKVELASPLERPKVQLELVNKRLEELNIIAQQNKTEKLAPAISQFQKSVKEATKNLSEVGNVTTSDPKIVKELAKETEKIEKNKEKVERVLGVRVGETEKLKEMVESLEKNTIQYLINDLSQRKLNDFQKELFEKGKEEFEKGNYEKALEKLLLISNNQVDN